MSAARGYASQRAPISKKVIAVVVAILLVIGCFGVYPALSSYMAHAKADQQIKQAQTFIQAVDALPASITADNVSEAKSAADKVERAYAELGPFEENAAIQASLEAAKSKVSALKGAATTVSNLPLVNVDTNISEPAVSVPVDATDEEKAAAEKAAADAKAAAEAEAKAKADDANAKRAAAIAEQNPAYQAARSELKAFANELQTAIAAGTLVPMDDEDAADTTDSEIPAVVASFFAAVDDLSAALSADDPDMDQVDALGQAAMDAYVAVEEAGLADYAGVQDKLAELMAIVNDLTGGAETIDLSSFYLADGSSDSKKAKPATFYILIANSHLPSYLGGGDGVWKACGDTQIYELNVGASHIKTGKYTVNGQQKNEEGRWYDTRNGYCPTDNEYVNSSNVAEAFTPESYIVDGYPKKPLYDDVKGVLEDYYGIKKSEWIYDIEYIDVNLRGNDYNYNVNLDVKVYWDLRYIDKVDESDMSRPDDVSLVKVGTTFTVKTPEPRPGYTFNGWKVAGAETIYDADQTEIMPDSDLTLVAQWEPVGNLSYTVKYLERGTDKVLDAKTVDDQVFGTTVTEYAIDIDGYDKVDPTSKTLVIDTAENVIDFYYIKKSYTIDVSVENGGYTTGSMPYNPDGRYELGYGDNISFSFSGDTGYALDKVVIDEGTTDEIVAEGLAAQDVLDRAGTYTFSNVKANHTIKVVYAEDKNGDSIPDKYQATVTYVAGPGAASVSLDKATVTLFDTVITKYDDAGDWSETGTGYLNDNQLASAEPDTGYKKETLLWTNDRNLKEGLGARGQADTKTPIKENITFTASFEPNDYTVTVKYYLDAIEPENRFGDNTYTTEDPSDASKLENPYETTVVHGGSYDVSDRIYPNLYADGHHYVVDEGFVVNPKADDATSNVDIDVVYAIDDIGTENPNEGDGVPDKYQATVKYVSADDTLGTVTGVTTKVFTLTDPEGNYVTSASIAPRIDGVIITPVEGYAFDTWETPDPDVAGPDVAIEMKGNQTYTYTANWKLADFGYTVKYFYEDEEGNDVAGNKPTNDAPEDGSATYGSTETITPPEEAPLGENNHYVLRPGTYEVTIGADASKNVINVYYDRDNIGTDPENPDKGDGVADKYQVTVTYVAGDGTASVRPAKAVVTLLEEGKPAIGGTGYLSKDQIATATAKDGFDPTTESWDGKGISGKPTTGTPITEDTEYLVTFQPIPPNVYTITVNYVDEEDPAHQLKDSVQRIGNEGDSYDVSDLVDSYNEPFSATIDGVEHNFIRDWSYPVVSKGDDLKDNITINVVYTTDDIGTEDPGKGDNVPDKYQATVTYKPGSGVDSVSLEKAVVTLVDEDGNWSQTGAGHLTEVQIAAATAKNGFDSSTESWDGKGMDGKPTTETNITEDVTYTISFLSTEIRYSVQWIQRRGENDVVLRTEFRQGKPGETVAVTEDDTLPIIVGGVTYVFDENDEGNVLSLELSRGSFDNLKIYVVEAPSATHSVSAQVQYFYGETPEAAQAKTEPDAFDLVQTATSWIGESATVTVAPDTTTPPYGYSYYSTEGELSYTVAAGEPTNDTLHIVKVYYVVDEGNTKDLSYTVEYYKDDVLMEEDTVERTV